MKPLTLLLFTAAFGCADAASTRQLFLDKCSVCHGADAGGSDRGPALTGNRRLRLRSLADIANVISHGTPGGMPAIPLAEDQLSPLADYVRSLNTTASEAKPDGDLAAGERFFFGAGNCAACHTAAGRGGSTAPDLSAIGRQLTLAELEQSLTDPGARIAPGYALVTVSLNTGASLRGVARSRGSHDLQLQTPDGQLHLLTDRQYSAVIPEPGSSMPPIHASESERKNLVAWLSRLTGITEGPAKAAAVPPQSPSPNPGDWPTYNGVPGGNRFSPLRQIDTSNVSKLQAQWIYPIQYQPLEMTPLVVDGIMYVTGPNQVAALDGQSGREIWRYSRPRTPSGVIAGDAALGANRGAAISADRILFNTDNAHMICLNRFTGALLWDVIMPEQPEHYGATAAPLVVNDLVISGVAGGDEGIHGFIAAYRIATGELAWRFRVVPKDGPPAGGSTWLTGTYDPETGLLYWPTGNPYPDTDGSARPGDNLYTNCDLALDAKTGELRWYFQYTPHDLHDWDAVQTPVLVNATFQGRARRLLLHANRNGYYYVLDRTTGKFLFGSPFVKKLTWSKGLDPNGRPILTPNNETTAANVKTCPAVRGATNWYSPAYSPQTNLFYLKVVEDCGMYRAAKQGGFGFLTDAKDPGLQYLRALNLETGKVEWEIPQLGPVESNYSGVLATSGGLVFYGETSGAFAAVNAKTGATLWHFETGATIKASPMTYSIGARQYVSIAAGANVLVFALPE